MALNFQDALNTKAEDIDRPPLMPIGTYRWMVTKHPTLDTIADGRFDVVDFMMKSLSALDDVDADDLAEFTSKAGELTNQARRLRFLFNKEDEGAFNKTMYYLKTFIGEHLKVDTAGMAMKEMLAATPNMTCSAAIKWRPDRDNPEIQYDEIGKTAPDLG